MDNNYLVNALVFVVSTFAHESIELWPESLSNPASSSSSLPSKMNSKINKRNNHFFFNYTLPVGVVLNDAAGELIDFLT